MKLLLVRHGQIESNVIGRLDSRPPGPSLNQVGVAQAANLVEQLADQPLDRIGSSDMVRAQQTATPLAKARQLPLITATGWREISCGIWEGRSDPAAHQAFQRVLISWMAPGPGLSIPEGESKAEFLTRFDAAINQICQDLTAAAAVAVVAHGAAIHVWAVARARNRLMDFQADWRLTNTGLVILVGGPSSGWDLLSWEGVDV